MMTKDLHQKLKKYEVIFKTAIDANYYRAMDSRFAADFINGCKELNVYINTSCPECVLRALQTVGKLYFAYRDPEPTANAEVSDASVALDNKTISTENKVNQNASKQPKKPIVVRSKTNKK